MPKLLTKKDIKDVFVKTLEPFAKAVQNDFTKVNNSLDKIGQDIGVLKQDVGVLKQEMREVKFEVREMKEHSSELFTKLDRFITLYETQRQELAVLGSQLRRLEDRVLKLEK